jgi:hypothetical protein
VAPIKAAIEALPINLPAIALAFWNPMITLSASYPLPTGGGVITPFDYYHVSGNSGLTVSGLSRGAASAYNSQGAYTPLAEEAYVMPFWVGASGARIDTLGVMVSGTSSSNINTQLGIYDNAPLGAGSIYPRNLLASVNLSGITSNGMKKATISRSLTEGLYWLAFIRLSSSTGNASFWSPNSSDILPDAGLLGYSTDGVTPVSGYYATGQTSLPSAFPSGALFATNGTKRSISIFAEFL